MGGVGGDFSGMLMLLSGGVIVSGELEEVEKVGSHR
jgi:hypothetical protein